MSWRRRLLAAGALVIGTVASAEVLVRLLLDPPGLFPKPEETPVMMEHPVWGFALHPGATGQYTAGGHSGRIHINERGFRDGSFEEAVHSSLRLLAAGDSFTLGLGVDSADPWPERLEAMLRGEYGPSVAVVNAAVPGYSARQMRQVAEALLPELQPRVVLFGVDVETYWRVKSPLVYLGGQLIKSSVVASVSQGPKGLYYSSIPSSGAWKWLHDVDVWLNKHFELGAHVLSLTRRVHGRLVGPATGVSTDATEAAVDSGEVESRMAPVLAEIGLMKEAADAGRVPLVVLLINPQAADGSFPALQRDYNRVVGRFCHQRGIGLVDPLPALVAEARGRPVFRSHDDVHWTRAAHRVAAGDVYRYLLREELLLPAGTAAQRPGRSRP